jgi:hypothetical protein
MSAKSTIMPAADLQTAPWLAHESFSADLFSIIAQGMPSPDDSVYLVSREGKKFTIKEKVLKDSSDFFKAALENSMRESGKKIIPFPLD